MLSHFLRLLAWIGGGLLLLLLLGGVTGYFWLLGSLPQRDGELVVAGAAAPIEILRDERGLVTIRAESHSDAIFGLGFVHAQDRMAQMELLRRVGTGRAAEIAGRAALRSDRLFRQLEFERLSRAAEPHLEVLVAGVGAQAVARAAPQHGGTTVGAVLGGQSERG